MDVAEVLSGKAGIEGVQQLLRGRVYRNAVRSEIASLLSNARLGPLYLRRAKLKPGRDLKVNYDARICPVDSAARSLRPIQVKWKFGESEPNNDLEKSRQVMQAEIVQRDLATPFHSLFVDTNSPGVWVQVSPLDPVFPQLVRLSDPQYVRMLLDRLETDSTSLRARVPADQISVSPVRYRPGERHVLRYELGNPADGREVIFAKIYKTSRAGSRAYQVATRVSDWLEGQGEGVHGASPLAYSPTEGAILYPRVIGMQLSKFLKDRESIPEKYLHLAGMLLHSLHTAPAELAESLETHTFGDEIRLVKRASEHVQVLAPASGEKIYEILDRAQLLYDQQPPELPTYTHSDYKADHLWVTSNGLTLIDFDTSSRRDPATDIGKFLADLLWWHVCFGKSQVELAQEGFIQGYLSGAPVPEERLVRARIYEAVILVKMTLRRVPIFDHCWAERTADLIRRAEEVVGKLENQLGQPSGL